MLAVLDIPIELGHDVSDELRDDHGRFALEYHPIKKFGKAKLFPGSIGATADHGSYAIIKGWGRSDYQVNYIKKDGKIVYGFSDNYDTVAAAKKAIDEHNRVASTPIPTEVGVQRRLVDPKDIKKLSSQDVKDIKDGDKPDGYFYHITSAGNWDGIKKEGLVTNRGDRNAGKVFYRSHSKDKVFFTDRGGVHNWIDYMQQDEDPKPKLVVLRVPKTSVKGSIRGDGSVRIGNGKDAWHGKAYYANSTKAKPGGELINDAQRRAWEAERDEALRQRRI